MSINKSFLSNSSVFITRFSECLFICVFAANAKQDTNLTRAVEIAIKYQDSLRICITQKDPRDEWKYRNLPPGYVDKKRMDDDLYWRQSVEKLRRNAAQTVLKFLSTSRTLDRAAKSTGWLHHPAAIEVVMLALGSRDSMVSRKAFERLIETAPYGFIQSHTSEIKKELRTAALSVSARREIAPYLVQSAAEHDSLFLIRGRYRGTLSMRALAGDSAATDSLIEIMRNTKYRHNAEKAIRNLAMSQSPRAANELVRLFSRPCYRDSIGFGKDTVTEYSFRIEIAKHLGRFHPTEPLFRDTIDMLSSLGLTRDPERVAHFVDQFRAWAKRTYDIDLPPEDPSIPLKGPCDITVKWLDCDGCPLP